MKRTKYVSRHNAVFFTILLRESCPSSYLGTTL